MRLCAREILTTKNNKMKNLFASKPMLAEVKPCEWISVKKKKPQAEQRVIIYANAHAFKQVEKTIIYDVRYYYDEETKAWYFGGWGIDNVTHWMPIPTKPNDSKV